MPTPVQALVSIVPVTAGLLTANDQTSESVCKPEDVVLLAEQVSSFVSGAQLPPSGSRGDSKSIIDALKKASFGERIRVEQPLTPAALEALPWLGFETGLFKMGDEYFLIKGDKTALPLPERAQFVFHTHVSKAAKAMFPYQGLEGNYLVDPKLGKLGAILSRSGVLIFTGDGFSTDSMDPFEDLFLGATRQGSGLVLGCLMYRACWEDHVEPRLFVPWELLRGTLPSKERPSQDLAVVMRQEGSLFHPKGRGYNPYETGRFQLVSFR
ncbi:MAG: hypothetical protein A2979_02930 [Deltaproteobacteria bacterium RIFCSPLOWO2_01_FULL_45_74]|nr:MAG: hypothetical protein A2712_07195 [Deltaproteobacteria bacterium RIFCSPHIGHO2_01_FULL_43_49]OGQ28701.1 MAG: hypothetical protein A3D98_00720 [Deltaproteobacteria bacterium RIFCSPHIGHO2_12_FULL_44_21]OGQ32024.1 MAG: hypothetical protein A2979_02930 [Deltaproteobacteria bacterium RIFCSPLOWO2_01_FULL_45_74]OGQ43637.1 MAG: hypothetical protein A3I70_03445 [Deltaproteobacteria bacterium RIFCSPLOWO2_02_FULL_44_34]